MKAVFPLICERSVPRPVDSVLSKKTERWQRILDEGTKVSGAVIPPLISKPVGFGEFKWDALPASRYAALLVRGAQPISAVRATESEIVFAVGPEGDWSAKEAEFLVENSFMPVSLGRRVLRASTAMAVGCGWFRLSGLNDGN